MSNDTHATIIFFRLSAAIGFLCYFKRRVLLVGTYCYDNLHVLTTRVCRWRAKPADIVFARLSAVPRVIIIKLRVIGLTVHGRERVHPVLIRKRYRNLRRSVLACCHRFGLILRTRPVTVPEHAVYDDGRYAYLDARGWVCLHGS